jgi:hypothetical protein
MTFRIRRIRCLAGIPHPALVQGRDSKDIPLLRFNPPLRFVPETSVLHLSVQNHSHGISFPFNASSNESPRPPRLTGLAARLGPKTGSASADGSHPADYGAAHRFSQPPSDFFLSLPSCHFQTGGVHGVRPPGIYSLYEASGNSSPPDYPLAVPPAGCAAPRS